MTDRGVSTVLDVSVFVLLVGAAVLALVTAPVAGPDPSAGRAEELATTLAASTTTVEYTADGQSETARGTYAGLLADAARAAQRNRTPGFPPEVVEATRPVLGGDGWRAQVVAVWRPYRGASTGRVVVGAAPPRDADVHAATSMVPSGVPLARAAAERRAASDGYAGVAAALADTLLVGANATERRRYVRTTTVELRHRFETPADAARAVVGGEARITVRTWSP